ncbi:hypothetical protein [Clostridium omnivorum]|uniref:Uncharacterized protein n=1 Tax=Clostridium omnivorum TaxID=1604902 RepID=A0ABQ5ND24_9CLOT|nr:hypothetical protein [Clostridium sp. E14]GLC32889.1 hypothetical protein bsdE14_42990 [Clostridium sp. E14]
MRGDVTRRIVEYMNSESQKVFNKYHICVIRECLTIEYQDRKNKGLIINSKSKKGKQEIYTRVSNIAKEAYKQNLDPEDIYLFKKCRLLEYEDRTGKCPWGYEIARKYLGYDKETGKELRGD